MKNPLKEGLQIEKVPEPLIIVIFGASGDLTRRKLIPALFQLYEQNQMPTRFSVIGFSRTSMTNQQFRRHLKSPIKNTSSRLWNNFASHLYYSRGNFQESESYRELFHLMKELDKKNGGQGNRLFYLAIPPSVYLHVIRGLENNGMVTPNADLHRWTRIVIEKPFGRDQRSARILNQKVKNVFSEKQIYRIDHYLGKETVRNMLIFRFANSIFEPVWNRRYIDHIQITVGEDIGVGTRGSYYEEAGILRDMFQNHLFQLLCLVAMEPSSSFDADAVRDEKLKVLNAIRPIQGREVKKYTARGQYRKGWISGEKVPGYREETGVSPDSTTPTYGAIEWHIDNWRWEGVPFYIRSGKRLPKKVSEITIHFRRPPHLLFAKTGVEPVPPNLLSIRIQPNEGISLRFEAKLPGLSLQTRPVTMDFRYGSSFGVVAPSDAYQRLLLDCMLGDPTLFTRDDEVDQSWELIDPIIKYWEKHSPGNFPNYEAGTWGPEEADKLLAKSGRIWRRP
jgi:glucose-6-phosphate 1-dehydrogenase